LSFERIAEMDRKGKDWSRDELIIAFNLYCRTPFGKINKSNRDIIRTANSIGRTPSSFARFDPILRNRNIKGLEHGSKQDEAIWKEFHKNWEGLAFESQRAIAGFEDLEKEQEQFAFDPDIPTEAQKSVRVRLVQSFFRDTVLSSYNFNCAVCNISLPVMLNASHIIPWSLDKQRRADPRNGICLCTLHDRAFDRGLITVQEDYKISVSHIIKNVKASKLYRIGLIEIEGEKINLPDRFGPDPAALAYHRERLYLQ
jgi:putative restriction endonuclease